MRLGHGRLESAGLEFAVPAREVSQVVDARDLEPDEVGAVVRDALRIRLREADAHLGRKRETLHAALTLARRAHDVDTE